MQVESTTNYNMDSLSSAFWAVSHDASYNHERMLSKLSLVPERMPRRALRDDYIRALEDVYNYRAQDKVRFDIRENVPS